MKPSDAATAAAAEYWATIDDVEAARPAARRHQKACTVLKDHMTAEGIDEFGGIEMVSTPGQRVDLNLLSTKNPDLVELCRVETVSRSLIPIKRPPKSRRRATIVPAA